jgi:small subunit ribosomal protein S1
MTDPTNKQPSASAQPAEAEESFSELFSQYEKAHPRNRNESGQGINATVVAVTGESVIFDLGRKEEGLIPLAEFSRFGESVKPGDQVQVTITGRDPEGYLKLARGRVTRTTDWGSLEKAYAEKAVISGTVTGVIKGGLTVDVGVRAFMPASRSGTRDAAELEKLVGQQIRCRISKLDVADEDVVVDRRGVMEEEERASKQRRFGEVNAGEIMHGTVRSIADYGAFVDIGGVDGLLHVSDIAWTRVNKPAEVLSIGQELDVKVLSVDPAKNRISLGFKQLQPHPWDAAAGRYKVGERVRGTVTRLMNFGAFVELEPGIEGLIHISEMSWTKRVRTPGDVVKEGDTVEAVILNVNATERRISLGLKQALGDPWAEAAQKFPAGSTIEGPVTNITKFGAFVQLAEGVEGMVHISEISAEKRLDHPRDVLHVGQVVKAQVLEIDSAKRSIRLSIKQLVPSSADEYISEHKEGDIVTGRTTKAVGSEARVELGEGVVGVFRVPEAAAKKEEAPVAADLSSLSSMLNARWKTGTGATAPPEPVGAGQVRSFRIVKLDPATKRIELELVENG